jgi:hypothetical protein
MNTISKTIRLFLDSIGRRSEYEFYLNKFQSDRSPCFALILPDSGSIQESGDLMTFDLHFLLRLELCPLVVLVGTEAEANAMELSRHGAVELLEATTLFQTDEVLHYRFEQCVQEEKIPILILPDMELPDVVPQLAPRLSNRLHVLRTSGMLHSPEGENLFYVYVNQSEASALSNEDQAVITLAKTWLSEEPQVHISVSSPLYVLQELFTVKGRGSIIRPGSEILHHTSLDGIDEERLVTLIEDSFGKTFSNPACLQNACDLYLEKDYRGAVVLESHSSGKYLSKFAVGTQARGEGVAQELWDIACASQPALFWRSRASNPINHWYERHASGHHIEGDWNVFWKGISFQDLPSIIQYALDRPADFQEN